MGQTIRLTTAQALVKFLNQQYLSVDGVETPFVEGLFNIYGHGNVLGIGEAMSEAPGHLKSYQGKNEQGMAHAAIAFSRQHLRRKIFAVTTSSGPGSANLVTAAGTAFANNIPVLFLPADTYASRQPDPVLQQLEIEHNGTLTTNDSLKAVSRYWDRIQRPEQLMSSLLRAFEVMTNPATAGPVTICLPQDTEGEAFDYDQAFFKRRVHYVDRQGATDRELSGAVALIKKSQRPVIIVGGGCKYSDARLPLEALATQCGIPLVETPAGKGTVPWNFSFNLGGTGILGTAAANQAISEADLIIGIGTRYTDFTTSSKTAFNPKKTQIININVNRMQTYKFDGFQLVGDAKQVVSELLAPLADYRANYGENLGEWQADWELERQRLSQITFDPTAFQPEIDSHFQQKDFNEYASALGTTLSQTAAFIRINEVVGKESIVVASAGSLPGDMQRLWRSVTPNTYHLEYGYSCMGYEIAGALGAKLAHEDREVYAVVGDGSFLMLHSELVTALQYHKKITVLLFDNSGYGCINNLQMSHGSPSYECEFRDSDNQIMAIDYAKIAEGYGAKSLTVNNLVDLEAALKEVEQAETSVLIHIKVLPKTMSNGYGGWWRVGVSEVSASPQVKEAYSEQQKKQHSAWQY